MSAIEHRRLVYYHYEAGGVERYRVFIDSLSAHVEGEDQKIVKTGVHDVTQYPDEDVRQHDVLQDARHTIRHDNLRIIVMVFYRLYKII